MAKNTFAVEVTFHFSLCGISSDISVVSDSVSNEAHVLMLVVLLWIVTGIICRYVVLSTSLSMLQVSAIDG